MSKGFNWFQTQTGALQYLDFAALVTSSQTFTPLLTPAPATPLSHSAFAEPQLQPALPEFHPTSSFIVGCGWRVEVCKSRWLQVGLIRRDQNLCPHTLHLWEPWCAALYRQTQSIKECQASGRGVRPEPAAVSAPRLLHSRQ